MSQQRARLAFSSFHSSERGAGSSTTRPTTARWRKPLLTLVSVGMLALSLAACGGGGTSSGGAVKSGGTLNVGLDSDAVTLDPLKSSALVDRQVMLNMYDTLVRVDAQNKIQPDLATVWSYPSPTQLVFTLRSDVKFEDGAPFNADAVVTNINRILNNPTSPRHSEISSVASVQAVDATHVQFNLSKPFGPLLAALTDRAGMMLSPTAISSGANLASAPKNAGSGPFEFSDWVKGDHLTLTRNPNYWGKTSSGTALPYLDKIVYHPITNESVMYTNLETNTIQVADVVGPTDVAAAKANPALTYKQISALSFFGIELNTQAAPFNNANARRAVSWGVNRQEIVNSVLHGVGVVAQGPISPTSWAYSSSIAPYSYDTSKAKAELQAGGLSSLSFTLTIPSGSPANAQEAQFLQSELQAAGITMTIKQETFASLLSDSASHNFQAALLGWSGRPDPDGNMYSWFHTGGGFNDMQYSNPQVDTLLEQARASNDQTQRATDYQQAETLMLQDAPYVFINHGVAIQATSKNVQGYTVLPTGIMEFEQVSLGS
ncbi:MAG TPA: ABC transporter substrate-binding protein [Ktedonobacterales bacterium]|jgi:peptide/nickel transport system substrate-binding protein|nr:ABC transporter substrate-binding protein [Ktedonobacterales bacterium]